MDPKPFLRALFDAAIEAVAPRRVLPPHLPPPPRGRTVLLAVGKAATAMAEVAAGHWHGPLTGLAVTRYGHAVPGFALRQPNIELIEAGHPVPDENSVAAARRALALARALGEDDLALVLISGGGSALWCLPVPELSLAGKQRITSKLLAAGASIRELNTVRRALSQIKGGKLAAAAAPALVETLIISDVVGDDAAIIASGPTVPGIASLADAGDILRRYRIEPPPVPTAMPTTSGATGTRARPGIVIASGADALAAAAETARAAGFEVQVLGDAIEGDAREAATAHAAIAREAARRGRAAVVLSGGEVTAAVRDGNGIGGPNCEFLLALALELDAAAGIYALACDSDGYDGVGRNAGALLGPDTLARARALRIDPRHSLETSDSARFFEALGDLVVTGPTQTNVSDFRALLVLPR